MNYLPLTPDVKDKAPYLYRAMCGAKGGGVFNIGMKGTACIITIVIHRYYWYYLNLKVQRDAPNQLQEPTRLLFCLLLGVWVLLYPKPKTPKPKTLNPKAQNPKTLNPKPRSYQHYEEAPEAANAHVEGAAGLTRS